MGLAPYANAMKGLLFMMNIVKTGLLGLLAMGGRHSGVSGASLTTEKRALTDEWDCLHFTNKPHDLAMFYDNCVTSGEKELAADVTYPLNPLFIPNDYKESKEITATFMKDPATKAMLAEISSDAKTNQIFTKYFYYGGSAPDENKAASGQMIILSAWAAEEPTELFNKFDQTLKDGYETNRPGVSVGTIVGASLGIAACLACVTASNTKRVSKPKESMVEPLLAANSQPSAPEMPETQVSPFSYFYHLPAVEGYATVVVPGYTSASEDMPA